MDLSDYSGVFIVVIIAGIVLLMLANGIEKELTSIDSRINDLKFNDIYC